MTYIYEGKYYEADDPNAPPGMLKSLRERGLLPAEGKSVTAEGATAPTGDDLTAIQGIGAARAARLAEAGYTYYASLRAADKAAIARAVGVSEEVAAAWQEEARGLR